MKVRRETLFQTVTNYEGYPDVMPHCSEASIVERDGSRTRVRYKVSLAGVEVEYTLDHVEEPSNLFMSWSLVQGNMMSENTGSWTLEPVDDAEFTEVHYAATLQLKLPLPSFVISKVLDSHLPEMLDHFEKAAQKKGLL
jgi:ribosome-associated toxin RatA of RatAB toxin-antitoxin module